MWQEKRENLILPRQLPFTSQSRQQPHWENKTLPPPSVKHDESSRKRKTTDIDSPGLISDYHFHWDPSPRDATSQSGLKGQRYNNNVCLNQVNSTEPVNHRPQFDKNYRGLYPNQSNSGHQFNNVHQHYMNISSKSWPNQNMDFNGSGPATMTNASYSLPSQHRGHHTSLERPVGQPFTVPNQQSQEVFMFGRTDSHINFPISKSCNTSSENAQVAPSMNSKFSKNNYTMCDTLLARPVEILQQNVVQPNGPSEDMNGITDPKKDNKLETSYEQYERNGYLGNKEQNHIVGDIKIKETKAMASSLVNQPTSSNISSLNGGSVDKINREVETNEKNDGLLKPDERSKSPCWRTSSTAAAEKLWDGSLQLNSSVTVSAIAFFKSGEKLLDINWSEFVEVKGKVRLEAFEKYIQDLPRSRNRGLMVISLYWKEGSSDSGLSGMKEVSKGYKEGKRVGFAHLSPSVDIYICPRSDTIITILAKYGFFKGMTAIDDNKDSMIGCVVWRKNRTSSNSDPKKGEIKNTISSNQIQANKNKNRETTEAQNEVVMSMVDARNLPTQDYSPIREPLGNCWEGEKINPNLEPEKTNPCLEAKKDGPSLERQNLTVKAVEQKLCTSDNDDLPEYDFGIIHGDSVVPKNKPLEALVAPLKPVVQPMSASSQRFDSRSSTPNQGVPITQNLEEHNPERRPHQTDKSEAPKNTCDELKRNKNLFDDNDDDMPEWCPPELFKKQLTEQIQPSTSLPFAGSTFQNMSPDPPRALLHLAPIRVSVPLPSALVNPGFQNMSSHPILPSPPSAAMRAPFSHQTFRPIITLVKSLPSVPLQNGPRSSMGFNPNFVPRPQYGDRRGWRP